MWHTPFKTINTGYNHRFCQCLEVLPQVKGLKFCIKNLHSWRQERVGMNAVKTFRLVTFICCASFFQWEYFLLGKDEWRFSRQHLSSMANLSERLHADDFVEVFWRVRQSHTHPVRNPKYTKVKVPSTQDVPKINNTSAKQLCRAMLPLPYKRPCSH